MIDDRCQGPFNLEEFKDAGICPDTYVWCKTMTDWAQAIEVDEINRYFKEMLAQKNVRTDNQSVRQQGCSNDNYITRYFARHGIEFRIPEETESFDEPPRVSVVTAILVTLFCFPFTGFVALYYTVKSRKEWENAMRSESDMNRRLYTSDERRDYKRFAHHYAAMAKMWTGISFFMGFILYAIIIGKPS